jgi:hypothetical protein
MQKELELLIQHINSYPKASQIKITSVIITFLRVACGSAMNTEQRFKALIKFVSREFSDLLPILSKISPLIIKARLGHPELATLQEINPELATELMDYANDLEKVHVPGEKNTNLSSIKGSQQTAKQLLEQTTAIFKEANDFLQKEINLSFLDNYQLLHKKITQLAQIHIAFLQKEYSRLDHTCVIFNLDPILVTLLNVSQKMEDKIEEDTHYFIHLNDTYNNLGFITSDLMDLKSDLLTIIKDKHSQILKKYISFMDKLVSCMDSTLPIYASLQKGNEQYKIHYQIITGCSYNAEISTKINASTQSILQKLSKKDKNLLSISGSPQSISLANLLAEPDNVIPLEKGKIPTYLDDLKNEFDLRTDQINRILQWFKENKNFKLDPIKEASNIASIDSIIAYNWKKCEELELKVSNRKNVTTAKNKTEQLVEIIKWRSIIEFAPAFGELLSLCLAKGRKSCVTRTKEVLDIPAMLSSMIDLSGDLYDVFSSTTKSKILPTITETCQLYERQCEQAYKNLVKELESEIEEHKKQQEKDSGCPNFEKPTDDIDVKLSSPKNNNEPTSSETLPHIKQYSDACALMRNPNINSLEIAIESLHDLVNNPSHNDSILIAKALVQLTSCHNEIARLLIKNKVPKTKSSLNGPIPAIIYMKNIYETAVMHCGKALTYSEKARDLFQQTFSTTNTIALPISKELENLSESILFQIEISQQLIRSYINLAQKQVHHLSSYQDELKSSRENAIKRMGGLTAWINNRNAKPDNYFTNLRKEVAKAVQDFQNNNKAFFSYAERLLPIKQVFHYLCTSTDDKPLFLERLLSLPTIINVLADPKKSDSLITKISLSTSSLSLGL